jgi:DNA-binding phage protein
MTKKLAPLWDTADYLKTDQAIVAYLREILEPENAEILRKGIGNVIRALERRLPSVR